MKVQMTNPSRILKKIIILKNLKNLKILKILKNLKKKENFEKLDNSKLRIGQDDDEFCNKILARLDKKDKKILDKYKINNKGILTGRTGEKFLPIIPEI